MRNKNRQVLILIVLIVLGAFSFCKKATKNTRIEIANNSDETNLVVSNHWFIAGPAIEIESEINAIREKDTILRVTVNNSPTGEIELHVPIISTKLNKGLPMRLPNSSTYIEITYKSTHLIKLQAREGNQKGTDCVHGGSQPRVDIPPSPKKFTTMKIPWSDFKLNGVPDGKLLDINNLCKFNFVNYNPIAGALLEITSVKLESFKL